MDPLIHRISAWDRLPIHVLEWRMPGQRGTGPSGTDFLPAILCLPGLVRTGADFEVVAPAIGPGRRVIAIDYPGRGRSGRSRDVNRYAPEACLRDVMDACAALHIDHAVAIGTSFGGLLTMGLAAARPGLIRAAVLNDIGPDINTDAPTSSAISLAMIPRWKAWTPVLACFATSCHRCRFIPITHGAAWRN